MVDYLNRNLLNIKEVNVRSVVMTSVYALLLSII